MNPESDISLLELILLVIFGSGSGTVIVGLFLKARFEKDLARHSKVFSDNLKSIKKVFESLVKVGVALDLYLSTREPEGLDERYQFKNKTVHVFDDFIKNFEENEIIFNEIETRLLKDVVELIKKVKYAHVTATFSENSRGSDFWKESVGKKAELGKVALIDYVKLRDNLKIEFQKKYKLLM
ncbi:hypothetical protein [Algoriphagus confluentis]|uniref:DUF4760 domain-containing protein n=1 Tax=Algoriphagus confluentis TaxID=1697556 RepID=A0ABQ6PPC7_9BACT|nr:hypothetical protein Aconfl_17280 [Algoriphagus confluentis]